MPQKAKTTPDEYHTITAYLCIKGAASAIEFYKKAFGANELMRIGAPGGTIGHAEIEIGDSRIMLADECPDMNSRSPRSIGGTPVHLYLYDQDVDARVQQAVAAGAKLLRPVTDQFYGDRSGSVEDPYGHVWHIATHKEDLSLEEIERRAAALHGAKE